MFNPCGTFVEHGRACFSSAWRLYKDSDKQEMVRWFYCKPGAKQLPYSFRTVLLPWEAKDFVPTPIGPVGAESFWDGGGNRGYDGQCIPDHGAWFMEGQPLDQLYEGVICCAPVVQPAGGIGIGGPGPTCLGTEDYRDILVEQSDRCISPYGAGS